MLNKLLATALWTALLLGNAAAWASGFADESSYLPLAEGNRWVLRGPGPKPITLEVLHQDGDGYRIRFDNPWGANDWTLVPDGDRYRLTKFGKDGLMMDLPRDTVYFDFGARKGQKWSNKIGNLSVTTRDAQVRTASRTYERCITIRQAANLVFTFAAGVGFVQFGEGRGAFVLDEAASTIGGGRVSQSRAARADDPDAPAPHVPTGRPASGGKRPPPSWSGESPRTTAGGRVLFGVVPVAFANEAQTPQNLLKRFEQTVDAGITFMVASDKWNELEPRRGDIKLEGVDFRVAQAQRLNIPIAYTLRLIDTVDRTLPSELKNKRWTDRDMQSRVMALIDALAPRFKDRVKWFMFGNEIDGYFNKHPNEVADYAQLYDQVARRLKQLVPGIQVSSTIMYGGIAAVDSTLRPLNERWDVLTITYYPIRGDFTMRDPGVAREDLRRMRDYAASRKVVLQEIGYPTSPLNKSSEEKQAQFFRNVFAELRANSDTFVAGSFFLLGDLRDDFVRNLAGFYGIPNAPTFLAFLQTLGMYDLQGRPKQSWSVFQDEIRR